MDAVGAERGIFWGLKASNIARMCEAKFDELVATVPGDQAEFANKLRKVLSGIVLERNVSLHCSTMQVVAIGTGNKIMSCDKPLSTAGDVQWRSVVVERPGT